MLCWPLCRFPYVRCLAEKMHQLGSEADHCAQAQGWDPAQISGCAGGDEGATLEKAAADETWGLRPRHTSVPHILVNGVPIWDDFGRLPRYGEGWAWARQPALTFPHISAQSVCLLSSPPFGAQCVPPRKASAHPPVSRGLAKQMSCGSKLPCWHPQ